MTNKQRKELRRIAGKLPVFMERYPMYMTPRQMGPLDRKEALDLPDVTVLDPNKRYLIKKTRPVNHYRRLKRVFEKEGPDGVVKYIGKVREFIKKNGKK